ncbi:poly-beta-1,6 N-acetyl-D-glucosamine export porin PgaA [Xanthomonas melonis]|nr:poly-beta-1,6 N-acetyl-D-glucosamine export porin PgaA [Xanthomonas melonis]MCC4599761.1 poly-beta-1,6 N-acetyl-D-glucosamine export porin PgaA [Xanthomonas melonis]
MTDASALTPMQQAERLRGQQRYADALAIYERVLRKDPRDKGAYTMRAFTLSDLGSAQLAAEAVWRHPDWFSQQERDRLDNDRIARMIGWASAEPIDAAHRYAETDQALANVARIERSAPPQVAGEATRLRIDRLIALNQHQRHRDVVAGYQALRAQGIEVPTYVLPTVGDSLMGLRRPAEAEAVLRQALQHNPDDFNTQVLLGYALLEQERFDAAMPVFERLVATQAPWPRRAGATSGYENWDRFSADIALATARSAANNNRNAERLLRERVSIGPDNAELQAALASIQARRGHTTQALQRNRIALTLDPHQKQARSGMVETQRDLDRLDLADAQFQTLRTEYPDDVGLQRLGASLQRQRGWQVHLSQSWGRSDNDERTTAVSPLGNHFGGTLLEAESPLLGERWRVGLRGRDNWADFQDTRVRYRSFWLGTHYRYDRLDFSAYGGRALDDFDRDGTAWALDAGWRFSDAWYASVAWRTRDPEASLQARRRGITADSIGASVRWTPSDERRWELQAQRLRYSDGNRRNQLDLSGSQRLWANPYLLLDGLLAASVSAAEDDRVGDYFNPRRSAGVTAGMRIEQIGWRRYDYAFRQRLEVTVGPTYQSDFGSQWVPALAYRHLWSLGDGSALTYGVSWSRPVYDGRREQQLGLDLDFRWGGTP